jgi:NADH dehydrogenase FAD-containing subunit
MRLIPREEKESSEIIEKVFKSSGIEVLTNSQIVKAE